VIASRSRRIEFVLLLGALIIGFAAESLVTIALGEPLTSLLPLAAVAIPFMVAHFVLRKWAPFADPILMPAVALLTMLGLVMIHRLDFGAGGRDDAPLQVIWVSVAVLLFTLGLTVVRRHEDLSQWMWISGIAGLILLGLPAVLPASISEVNGARIWIRLFGLSIQPGEFAKVAFLIFFSAYLMRTREALTHSGRVFLGIHFPKLRNLAPLLAAWLGSVAVLAFERDLGTSLLFFATFILLMYVATSRVAWLIIGFALFIGGALTAYRLFDHVQQRLTIWLDPWPYANDQSYQLLQGLYGLATGGIFGTGLGQGRPTIVPFAKTDFIISALGEELGLAGVMALLVLYAIVVQRILRIAMNTEDSFGQLFAAGSAIFIGLQTFIVIGGVTRLIPLTGLTTPFLSYGGSSLVANWLLIALVLRISHARYAALTNDVDEDLDQTRVIR
jgi:cell division protein FtsW (lipid II flippase)